MLITKEKLPKEIRYWRSWHILFHWQIFASMFSSKAEKQLASAAPQTGKTAAKDIGMKANDVGKTVAIDADKKLVEKAAKRLSIPKSQVDDV